MQQAFPSERLADLLSNWDLEPVVSTELFHTDDYRCSDRVLFIQTDANRYTLKRTSARPAQQFTLLDALSSSGVPVAVPVKTRDGAFFIHQEEVYYCLSPYLAGSVVIDHYAAGAGERIFALGAALARLHNGLAHCETRVAASEMDLPRDVMACSQVLREKGPSYAAIYDAALVEAILAELNAGLAKECRELPTQLIHRDPHCHNVLFQDGQVSGWLDFELLTRGPRLFDLGYCATSLLMTGWGNPGKQDRWLDLLGDLAKGYGSANPLTSEERSALWTVLLSIEVLFAAYFINAGDEMGVRQNLEALGWIYQNRHQFQLEN